jgi:hypothetical protein
VKGEEDMRRKLIKLALWFLRWNAKKEGSNYVKHAARELQALGYSLSDKEEGPNKWIQANLFELLAVFAAQGHSGSSAPYCVNMFSKLALFELLCPLTGETAEWNNIDSESWQNNRCSHVFKGKNGVAYDIDGYVFWHWSERPLESDEEGYPGISRFKSYFKSNMSRKLVTFPYQTQKPEYVEVDSFEVNKESNEREPGSGWWETIYPDHIIKENAALKATLAESI